MTALLLASLLCQQADPLVSLQIGAARLTKIAEELQRAAQVPVRAEGVLADQVAALICEKQPFSVVRQKLAYVSSGTWENKDGVWVLSLSSAQEKKDWEDEVAYRLSRIKAYRKEQAEAAAGNREIEETGGQGEANRDPVERLVELIRARKRGESGGVEWGEDYSFLQRLGFESPDSSGAEDIDPAVFAALPPYRRVVFALNPTRLQRPLPRKVMDRFAAMAAKNAKAKQALTTRLQAYGLTWEDATELIYYPTPDTVKAVYLTAYPTETDCSVSISVYMNEGSSMSSGSGYPMVETSWSDTEEVKRDPLKYSNTSKVFGSMLEKGSPTGIPDVMADLLNWQDKEPLQWTVGEGLEAIAKAKSTPLAALIPDYACSDSAETMDSLVSELKQHFKTESGDGWTTLRPLSPTAARMLRDDRQAVTECLKTWRAKGFCSGELRCQLGAATSLSEQSPARQMAGRSNISDGDRLFGSLTDAQRSVLRAGKTVAYSQLTKRAKSVVERLVYWGQEAGRVQDISEGESEASQDLDADTTSLFPDGIPATTQLVGQLLDPEKVLISPQTGETYSITTIAYQLVAGQNPDLMGQYQEQLPSKFYIGDSRELQFRIALTPKAGLLYSFTDQSDLADRTLYTLQTLPGPMRKQLDEALKEVQEWARAAAKERAGQKPPPY